jgi:hypothetical protein
LAIEVVKLLVKLLMKLYQTGPYMIKKSFDPLICPRCLNQRAVVELQLQIDLPTPS